MARKSATLKNRDIMEATQAMAVLTSDRWADSHVAFYLGKSFRALREANEDVEKTRMGLLEQFAVRDEDGGYKKDQFDGMIRLTDPKAFNAEWRKLLDLEIEVTLYPVNLEAISAAQGTKRKRCKECDRPYTPNLSIQQLEALVHVGAILYEPTDEDEKIEQKEDEE